MRYRFRLDRGETALPDPASRFQPEGPHGPSEIVDPGEFAWTDRAWRGWAREQLVIYEMHVGTFTPDGSWEAAARELPALAELGITCHRNYARGGIPGPVRLGIRRRQPLRTNPALRPTRRIFAASSTAPMLSGSPSSSTSSTTISARTETISNCSPRLISPIATTTNGARRSISTVPIPGRCANSSSPMRAIGSTNIISTGCGSTRRRQIFDRSEDHIIAAIVRQVRSAGRGRSTFVVGENEPQHARLVRPAERGGYGLDALWNDDFHHSAMVALTGHHEAYYSDYRGRPREFVAAAKHGFLYQGQRYQWQRNARGTPTLDLPAECFVVFLQNHDQIANSGTGERCHALTSPGRLRAMTAYFLLMPGIPMLFQGQEFGASSPFFYFADHESELSRDVREGRRRFLAQFPSLATSEMQAELADPGDIDTFRRSVLDLGERQRHASIYALHRDLLALRRTDPVLGQRPCRIDGAALTDEAWMLRFFSRERRRPFADCQSRPRPPARSRTRAAAGTGRGPGLAALMVQRGPRLRWFGGPGAGCRRGLAHPGPKRHRPRPRILGHDTRGEERLPSPRSEWLICAAPPATRTRYRRLPREWLVANGLGGYASATVTGAITRRYHGFLIAAQPAPLGRMVVLNDLEVDIELEDGSVVNLREKADFSISR